MTLPNFVSAARIALVPLFLWLLLGRDQPAAAGWLLVAIGATDWVDGYLARRLDQVSDLGKVLDPLADRLAVAAAVIGGWISGTLPWGVALALVIRESAVAVGALFLLGRRLVLPVRFVGKVATFALYGSLAAFLVHAGGGGEAFRWLAWATAIPGVVLYYVVAALYARDARRALTGGGPVIAT